MSCLVPPVSRESIVMINQSPRLRWLYERLPCLFEIFIKILTHSNVLAALTWEKKSSLLCFLYHLITEDPTLIPKAPPASRCSLLRRRPSFQAVSCYGNERAEDVFPYLSMFTNAFSIGNSSFSIRCFNNPGGYSGCGIIKSISLMVSPFSLVVSKIKLVILQSPV